MGLFQNFRIWFNSLIGGGGGKRVQRFATQTADGQAILIDSSETVIGNAEATEFFRDICGGSLKEVMLRQGLTNIPVTGGGVIFGSLGRVAAAQQMTMFKKFGVRLTEADEAAVYAKPGTYPHVEIGGGGVPEPEPDDRRPLVIKTGESDRPRATHASVVFTVFDVRRQSRQKLVTVHFHGRGVIRAKGFTREVGAMGRPTHYDGEEVKAVLQRRAPRWADRIYWCSPRERY
jgi:hypothetical protein